MTRSNLPCSIWVVSDPTRFAIVANFCLLLSFAANANRHSLLKSIKHGKRLRTICDMASAHISYWMVAILAFVLTLVDAAVTCCRNMRP